MACAAKLGVEVGARPPSCCGKSGETYPSGTPQRLCTFQLPWRNGQDVTRDVGLDRGLGLSTWA